MFADAQVASNRGHGALEALTQFQTILPHRSGLLQEAYWHEDLPFAEAGEHNERSFRSNGGSYKIRLD